MNMLRQFMRLPFAKGLWTLMPLGSLDLRAEWGIFEDYPAYGYGVYSAAVLAKRLNVPRITVIEFGVAGGRGLIALERISRETERALGIGIDVVGFDTGAGMPPPTDHRDLAHVWTEGFFKMNEAELRARLRKAELVLGDVGETVDTWVKRDAIAPVGFISFDLDYYSSTMKAFRLFEAGSFTRLPRVHCYFDDVVGPDYACMNEHVGELAAIRDFNDAHTSKKISQIINLKLSRNRPERWNDQMFAFHDFEHPAYMRNVTPRSMAQLPL